MKKYFSIIILVMLLAACNNTAKSGSPSEAFDNVYQKIIAEDYEGLEQHLSTSMISLIENAEYDESEWPELITNLTNVEFIESVKRDKEKIDGDFAEVIYRASFKDGSEEQHTMYFTKEKEKWVPASGLVEAF